MCSAYADDNPGYDMQVADIHEDYLPKKRQARDPPVQPLEGNDSSLFPSYAEEAHRISRESTLIIVDSRRVDHSSEGIEIRVKHNLLAKCT